MPKIQRTEAERKAWGAKMKAAREAKARNDKIAEREPELQARLQDPQIEELARQVKELQEQLKVRPVEPTQGAQLTQRGVVGTIDRYNMDLSVYPDPRQRLSVEPRLKRFSFSDNYELTYEVKPMRYPTIDGIWRQEPQFTLELIAIKYDEETGDPTDGRYTVCRGIFFEDPDAASIEAQQQGISFEDYTDQQTFLNEMRYLRMRNWLLEAFFPPTNDEPKTNKREMVIGNKLVETWEVSSTEKQAIPFGNLNTKL